MSNVAPQQPEIKHPAQGSDVVAAGGLPVDFDPERFPIIATHVYGWRPITIVAAQVVQDLTFRRKVRRLVAKGDRIVGEMLAELAADRNLGTVNDEALDRYLAIPDEALDITNGRGFPPPPLHEVQS